MDNKKTYDFHSTSRGEIQYLKVDHGRQEGTTSEIGRSKFQRKSIQCGTPKES